MSSLTARRKRSHSIFQLGLVVCHATLGCSGSEDGLASDSSGGNAPVASGGQSTTGGQSSNEVSGTGASNGELSSGGYLATGGAATGGAAAGGTTATGGSDGEPQADLGLHVDGNRLLDGNGDRVVLRGPELVYRWGTYAGLTEHGVDVAWEGGRNNNIGDNEIREVGKTQASALRLFGGFAGEIDQYLHTAIIEQKMFVAIARVNWADPGIRSVLKKYAKYLVIHPRGEFTHQDAQLWRREAITAIAYIRSLGYTSPIEMGPTGYGQSWSTIASLGREVAASDPLKNTLFLLQLYSEYAPRVSETITEVAAFPYPVVVDSCLFQGGIDQGYGNTDMTYRQVWDQSFENGLSSFYWDWFGDGEGNSMTTAGTLASLNGVGQYIVNDSPAALKNTIKTTYQLNASLDDE